MQLFLLPSLLPLLLLSTTAMADWNPQSLQKREHSLVRPYQSSGFGVPGWDFQGSTMVTNSYIRLTPDQQGRQGALWNRIPCRTRNWEVQVQFRVTGTTRDLFGDGFAFWYSKDRMVQGPVFGSRDQFSGLAILADTYANGPATTRNHPYISAMVNNGTVAYDQATDGAASALGGCQAQLRNLQHETWLAIRYENDRLTVSHDLHNQRSWSPCFTLDGVRLPTGYYFGLSATTGDLSDAHDIIAVKTYELDTAPGVSRLERADILPEAPLAAAPWRQAPATAAPGMSAAVKVFLGVVAVVVVGVGAYFLYYSMQETSRKRFY